jgi:ferredoxin
MPTVLAKNLNSDSQEVSFTLNDQEIIYEGFERNGVNLPHGCLSGSCGACRIEILDGVDNLSPLSSVEQDTVDFIKLNLATKTGDPNYLKKFVRLSCRAKVTGNVSFTPLK